MSKRKLDGAIETNKRFQIAVPTVAGSSSESESDSDHGPIDDSSSEMSADSYGMQIDDAGPIDLSSNQMEEIPVSFDFCDPNEKYFHPIRSLIDNRFFKDEVGLEIGELAELIINQGAVGTFVVQEGGRDVFAFITVLPLSFHKDKPAISSLVHYLKKKNKHMETKIFRKNTNVGLLIHERMINLPLQIIPTLHNSVLMDIDWAIENEISDEHKEKFKFDSYLVLAPCEKQEGSQSSLSQTVFLKFEDETLVNNAGFYMDLGGNVIAALLTPEEYKRAVLEIERMACSP